MIDHGGSSLVFQIFSLVFLCSWLALTASALRPVRWAPLLGQLHTGLCAPNPTAGGPTCSL